ncbi:MAG: arsenite methyltransferase [Phycisphaeraceae bacterium]
MSCCNDSQKVHEQVRDRYGEIARQSGKGGGGCCDVAEATCSTGLGYTAQELATLPAGADLGLGSGHPVAAAALKPGETVLDLGSGAGIDCLLAARQVGPGGRVIGVDMTPDMVEAARANVRKAGAENVTIHEGQIERLPIEDASVDVVISNCVVNLSPDKPAVWREVYRVLRPGGRVVISDVVATKPLPAAVRDRPELLCGCVSGAASFEELERWLAETGFVEVRLEPAERQARPVTQWLEGDTSGAEVLSTMIHARKAR